MYGVGLIGYCAFSASFLTRRGVLRFTHPSPLRAARYTQHKAKSGDRLRGLGPHEDTMADNLDKDGATKLAARINAYWQARGVRANARVERESERRGVYWVVRSDLTWGAA